MNPRWCRRLMFFNVSQAFAKETGRELKLELEPGTFLVANSGVPSCKRTGRVRAHQGAVGAVAVVAVRASCARAWHQHTAQFCWGGRRASMLMCSGGVASWYLPLRFVGRRCSSRLCTTSFRRGRRGTPSSRLIPGKVRLRKLDACCGLLQPSRRRRQTFARAPHDAACCNHHVVAAKPLLGPARRLGAMRPAVPQPSGCT